MRHQIRAGIGHEKRRCAAGRALDSARLWAQTSAVSFLYQRFSTIGNVRVKEAFELFPTFLGIKAQGPTEVQGLFQGTLDRLGLIRVRYLGKQFGSVRYFLGKKQPFSIVVAAARHPHKSSHPRNHPRITNVNPAPGRFFAIALFGVVELVFRKTRACRQRTSIGSS
jgi:hypothetical protein